MQAGCLRCYVNVKSVCKLFAFSNFLCFSGFSPLREEGEAAAAKQQPGAGQARVQVPTVAVTEDVSPETVAVK